MSTIRDVSERVLRIINGGDYSINDSKYGELDVQYLVRDGAAKLIKGEWFNERNEGGAEIDPRYIVSFSNQTVEVDSSTGENYVEVPVNTYIRLPDGAGIRSVRPDNSATNTKRTKKSELRAFIPIPNRFMDIYWQLPAASLEHVFGWELRKDRIYFTKKDGKTLKQWDINEVKLDIVSVDTKAVTIDEHLPLSSEMIQTLINEVITILKGGDPRIVDVVDNSNPNITKAQ